MSQVDLKSDRAFTSQPSPTRGGIRRAYLPPGASMGFAVAILAVIIIAVLSYASLRSAAASADRVSRTVIVLDQLQAVLDHPGC